MNASLATPTASPARLRPSPLPAVFTVWTLGSIVPLMIGFVIIPMFVVPIPLGWLATAAPAAAVFGLIGATQQTALAHSPGLVPVETESGWAGRTLLGGPLGILAYLAVLEALGALYGESPLLSGRSIFRPGDTEVEVGAMLAGIALMGAVLSAAQWRPWRPPGAGAGRRRGVAWTLSGALIRGAAGVVLWHVYENRIGAGGVYFADMGIGIAATLTAIFGPRSSSRWAAPWP